LIYNITLLDWIVVASLMLFGLGLVLVEIIFIPGTTVVGILGIVFSIVGIFMAYDYFGQATGTSVLVGFLVFSIVATVYSFKSGVWRRFAHKQVNSAKVNEDVQPNAVLTVGDKGLSTSSLRPMGNAEFHDQIFEVTTLGNYLPANEHLIITSITDTKIIVEPHKALDNGA